MEANPNNKFHVIYLGESGFPLGLAAIQKMIMVSKSLIAAGAKVTVVNRKGKFAPDSKVKLKAEGVHEDIHYVYTPGTVYRPKSFIARNLLKVKGAIGEFLYIRRLAKQKDVHAAIVSCRSFNQAFLFRVYGLLYRFPVVLNYVEWASVMQHRKGLRKKFNDFLFDGWMVKWMDGAMPISEVLDKNFKKIAPQKAAFKIPILCDFDKFNQAKKADTPPYFLYCGALDYKQVINFVLKAYDQLPDDTTAKLYLVLGGGSKAAHDQLVQTIAQAKKADRIEFFYNVPHGPKLVELFVNAIALLIPLRPSLQDAARFPHKIGEYVATGNPMVATNCGEVAHYFKDEETALVAANYDEAQFAERMQFVIDHPERAKEIGQQGRALGLREFNYLSYGDGFLSFLKQLFKKKNH